tara:strand:- start:13260 stop:16934 length:3675 start_codon:yes stop_codon:yes gene_type:complete
MPKSNYPNKIDTSVEIRPVRDNITEIGSDVINSLRSAIFQIEKTLGINPHGATGSTVASRISSVIDEAGKIKKDALDKANILAGPISDNDVSKDAAILESKLKLNFPTNLLQDEISILTNKLESFINMLEELSGLLSAHVHPEALNRHFAKAINLDESAVTSLNIATMSLKGVTVQEAFESIYNAHINFSGDAISSSNNSHNADQIYYDNSKTSEFIEGNSAQEALDEMVSLEGRALKRSMLNLHSNGLIRSGTVVDEFEALSLGTTLVDSTPISYTGPSSSSNEKIIFSSPVKPLGDISQFDIITISGIVGEDESGSYVISEVEFDAAGNLASVDIYGGPRVSVSEGATARVTKNIYGPYNENGLNACVRPRYNKTNTPDIQIAHPNSATIITSGVDPNKITKENKKFAISIDGEDPIDIDIFDEDFGEGGQSLDSIVYKINEFSVDNRLGFMAYKLRRANCYELALSHILPNMSGDVKNRTLKISEPSTNSAISELGFEADKEVEGGVDNLCLINGSLVNNFGRMLSFSNLDASIVPDSTKVRSSSDSVDFLKMGVREGDLIYISGADNPTDDGPYRINDVSSGEINVDFWGDFFTGTLTEDSKLYILRLSAHVGEIEFDRSGANGGVIFDTFVTSDADIFFKKRMVIGEMPETNSFSSVISGVSRNFISDTNAELKFYGGPGLTLYAAIRDGAGEEGDKVAIVDSGSYKVFSASKMSFITLEVKASGVPQIANPATTVPLVGHLEVPPSAYPISRGTYSTNMGMVLGKVALQGSAGGVPSLTDIRATGTTDNTIISENFIERYIQGPRNELRGHGIIRGVTVESVNAADSPKISLSISAGIAIVNGIRYEYVGNDNFVTYKNSNFFVGIDSKGCIVASEDVGAASPFAGMDIAHIAYIDIVNNLITDLRLFVDHIDYKLVADITVANDQEFGHFTSIKKAVDYSRIFTRLFPKMGRPSILIKEGTHVIDETIYLDFDIEIKGAGPQAIIKRGEGLYRPNEELGTNYTIMESSIKNSLFCIGSKTRGSSEEIIKGITIANLSFETSDFLLEWTPTADWPVSITNSFIFITQSINKGSLSESAFFRFVNLNFLGPKTISFEQNHEFAIVATRGHDHPDGRKNLTFGNIVVSNCMFNRTGSECGSMGVVIDDDATNLIKNIIITSNIFINVSPNMGKASQGQYNYFGVQPGDADHALGIWQPWGNHLFNMRGVIADSMSNVSED